MLAMIKELKNWWYLLEKARFDFTLKHILVTWMGKLNKWSKRTDWKIRAKNNNKNHKVIK